METRPLGRTGAHVSAIGFGAWPLAGRMGAVDPAAALDALRVALDAGVTVVDTAQGYFESERLLGHALRGVARERLFLVSKVTGDYRPAAIEAAVEQSLRALGVDVIDLYFVHHWRSEFPLHATMETMAELRLRGRVRFLGVSNFDAEQTRAALAITPIDAVQPPYSMLDRDAEHALLPLCQEAGLGVLTHSTLAKGMLSGKYPPGHRFDAADERSVMATFQGPSGERLDAQVASLRDVAAAKSVTLAQLAIAWVLRDAVISCALVGAKDPAQMTEALGALDVHLADDDVAKIESILRRDR